MAQLVMTQYYPGTTVIQMLVNMAVQGQVTPLTVTAQESDLLLLAVAAGRTDWGTEDCRTFATNALGLTVT